MTATNDRASALIAGIERAVGDALDRQLPGVADRLADEVAERVLDRLGDRRPVTRLVRDQLDQRYPARDAAAWGEGRFARKACPPKVRLALWRWRTGRTAWARRSTIEEMVRQLGGDPVDSPGELPAVEAEEAEAT